MVRWEESGIHTVEQWDPASNKVEGKNWHQLLSGLHVRDVCTPLQHTFYMHASYKFTYTHTSTHTNFKINKRMRFLLKNYTCIRKIHLKRLFFAVSVTRKMHVTLVNSKSTPAVTVGQVKWRFPVGVRSEGNLNLQELVFPVLLFPWY